MSENLKKLSAQGVSIWLDDISRERLRTGNLEQLIREKNVVGVTSNPWPPAVRCCDERVPRV